MTRVEEIWTRTFSLTKGKFLLLKGVSFQPFASALSPCNSSRIASGRANAVAASAPVDPDPLVMRVVPLLVAALLDLAGAGQVLSSMRPSARVRTAERGAVGSGDDTLESFRHCVQRLRDTPNAARSLRAVLGYIERASAHPRSKICMWDPEFCEHVAPTPEARECLLAAGFVALETNDASGTPYLAHRRIPPRMLRAMALELKRQAAELEGGGGGAPPAPPPNASSALAKPRADAGVRREAERLGTGAPTAVAEAEQVEQIMGMITGIHQGARAPGAQHTTSAHASRHPSAPHAATRRLTPRDHHTRAPVPRGHRGSPWLLADTGRHLAQ